MILNITKQLVKGRCLIGENIAMFERLPIVIFMKNFYQFPLIISYLFWNKVCKKKEYYGKCFKKYLT